MTIEKSYWYDHKPSDDNKGFIYGIYYIDNESETDPTEIIHTEWFKTKAKRNHKYKKHLKKYIN